jgi:pterin-4a-carbinolamine dehydratase
MITSLKIKESVKFANYEKACKFAKRVNGKVNDLSNDPKAKSKYSVTFERIERPSKGRIYKGENDFNYPNDFWR